jgi:hypothetical protein
MLQRLYIYCKRLFQMFHLFQSYVATRHSCCMCRPPALVSMRALGPSCGHRRGKGGAGCAAPVWKRLARFLGRGVRRNGGDWRPTRPCGDWAGGGGESSERCGTVPRACAKTVPARTTRVTVPARVPRESKRTNRAGPDVWVLASHIFLWQHVVRDPVISYFEIDFHHVVFGCPA